MNRLTEMRPLALAVVMAGLAGCAGYGGAGLYHDDARARSERRRIQQEAELRDMELQHRVERLERSRRVEQLSEPVYPGWWESQPN